MSALENNFDTNAQNQHHHHQKLKYLVLINLQLCIMMHLYHLMLHKEEYTQMNEKVKENKLTIL